MSDKKCMSYDDFKKMVDVDKLNKMITTTSNKVNVFFNEYQQELQQSKEEEEQGESKEEESFIIPDEEVDEFVRINPELICDGNREFIEKFHKHYDNWDSWEPESPLDKILKNAINKIEV